MTRSRSRHSGPRSEVSVLLPAAMLLLVVLSSIALFSYRATLQLLVEHRQAEADAAARRLAMLVSQEGWATEENLKQRVFGAQGVAVLDGSGWPVLGGPEAEDVGTDTFLGEAPFQIAGRAFRMRVELPGALLLSRQRGLVVMTRWILMLDFGILALVFLSMRRLLVPIDQMIEKARKFASPDKAAQLAVNEVGFLASTFDSAVGEIAQLTEAYRLSREERLADSLTQLGELTAGVAHEMRNSIATLKGYVELIDRDPAREMLVENLAEIRRESEHLHRVLEDFLSFARPGSVRLARVDLRQVLVRALEDPALGGQAYRLRVEPEGDWAVSGDSQLLERALRNLLSNAVGAQARAGREGNPLLVSLCSAGEMLKIRLQDSGEGIPPELLPRLFEPFAAGHPKGVGLGLALTRRILILHGGQVSLESEEEVGTTANVLLPKAARARQS